MEQQNLIPLPSLAERDRRYKNVRERMAREGLDVLLLPANHSRWEQMMADSRYLSGIGGFATEVFTVFPAEGDPAAYVFNRAGWWKQAQNWTADVRDGRNRWAQNAIEKLNEMGFKKGRIGISGLAGLVRAPEGIISYSTVEAIRQAFPDSGNRQCNGAHAGSPRPQERRRDRLFAAFHGYHRGDDSLHEGKRASGSKRKRSLRGDDPYHAAARRRVADACFFSAPGRKPRRALLFRPIGSCKPATEWSMRSKRKYGGYAAQAVCPMVVGQAKDNFAEMVDLSAACFHAILQQMRPGVTFGTLFDTYQKTVQEKGKDMFRWSHPMMHSRGLGRRCPRAHGG